MMFKFIWLFLFFSVIMSPAIYYNSLGKGYDFVPAQFKSYEGNTLGNMGYSSVQCSSIPLLVKKISISCPFGVIGEFLDYGINHNGDGGEADSCMTTEFNKPCRPDAPNFTTILNGAIGKSTFAVELSEHDIHTSTDTYTECTL